MHATRRGCKGCNKQCISSGPPRCDLDQKIPACTTSHPCAFKGAPRSLQRSQLRPLAQLDYCAVLRDPSRPSHGCCKPCSAPHCSRDSTAWRAGPDYSAVTRNLALELVRVTEAAALAGAQWLGKGDKNAADQVRSTLVCVCVWVCLLGAVRQAQQTCARSVQSHSQGAAA